MITEMQFFEEMILNIINQGYASIHRYENGFPIPSSDQWVYDNVDNIIDCLIEQEKKQ